MRQEIVLDDGTVYANYEVYLKGKHWVKTRKRYYAKRERACVVCYSDKQVQLHHRYYTIDGQSILGKESVVDLCCLCRSCQIKIHDLKLESRLRSENWYKRIRMETLRKKMDIHVEHRPVLILRNGKVETKDNKKKRLKKRPKKAKYIATLGGEKWDFNLAFELLQKQYNIALFFGNENEIRMLMEKENWSQCLYVKGSEKFCMDAFKPFVVCCGIKEGRNKQKENALKQRIQNTLSYFSVEYKTYRNNRFMIYPKLVHDKKKPMMVLPITFPDGSILQIDTSRKNRLAYFENLGWKWNGIEWSRNLEPK